MQVAVARVEHVADAERVAVADLGDAVHDVGQRERGTTASWTARSGAIRPIAPNAFFRPCQSRARSAALDALADAARAALAQERLDRARPRPRPARAGRRARPAARRPRRSDSRRRRSTLRPPRRRPGPSSPARRARCPCAMIAETASLAARTVGEVGEQGAHARRQRLEPDGDRGWRCRTSLRCRRRARRGRGPTARRAACRASTTEPSGSTTSSATMWLVVTPYLRQCGPPAFSATLPPTVQAAWLDGSGT